ncbi:hypothetical protein JHL17_13290 [Azospirillum sp. YIM B02556]|uniref:Uncharacterized protein n=1 Tax=Azospirillum endophyticum TaxID=2800326 RepID=A0ABS1F4N4_9PROT|nr:hypothetical protein [Azospirillum endophyticum]MBK1838388.1 hypothetical protein [Azospirillum endophyticum]
MSPMFRLALGLAAVDGLASAFVATLLLAFFVIGSGEQSAAIDVSASDVLLLKKSVAAGPMTVQILGILSGEGSSLNAQIIPNPAHSGLLPVTDAREMTDKGLVYWFDCSSVAAACQSQLVIIKPRRDKCWHFRISAANTSESFSDTFPSYIGIEVMLMPMGGSKNAKTANLPVDGRSWIDIRLHCRGIPLDIILEKL